MTSLARYVNQNDQWELVDKSPSFCNLAQKDGIFLRMVYSVSQSPQEDQMPAVHSDNISLRQLINCHLSSAHFLFPYQSYLQSPPK